MVKYKPTTRFTMVPLELSNNNVHHIIMDELFDSDKDQAQIKSLDIPHYNTKILYSFLKDGGNKVLPTIYKYLITLPTLRDYNKVILEYNLLKDTSLIVVAEGDKLLIANSYKTINFATAIYYILEILNKSQMNPKQTNVNIYGSVHPFDLKKLEKFVRRVRVSPI